MKVVKGILVAALVMSIAGAASASSVVGKVWYAEASTIDEAALLYGGACSLSLSESLWLSASYLMGTYDDFDIDTKDGEIVLGYTANIVDFGIGGRITSWSATDDADDDFLIFGPMVYVGLGNTIGDLPLGWYVGGSYMFLDLGDAYDEDDDSIPTFEHYNVEGGLFLALGQLSATCGYRYKEYTDSDIDLDFSGIVASAGIGF